MESLNRVSFFIKKKKHNSLVDDSLRRTLSKHQLKPISHEFRTKKEKRNGEQTKVSETCHIKSPLHMSSTRIRGMEGPKVVEMS